MFQTTGLFGRNSVVEHVKKVVDVLVSVSKSLEEFSGEENNLVKNALADSEMIYATNDENEIQLLEIDSTKRKEWEKG